MNEPSSSLLPGDLDPLPEHGFGPDEARHLLLRAGFGATPEWVREFAAWGLEKSVEHLLEVEAIPFESPAADLFDRSIMTPPTPAERLARRRARRAGDEDALAEFRRDRQRSQRDDRRQLGRIRRWWLERMIQTPRPLEEKMTLFWHGHFATSYRTIEDSYHMYRQNQLFRKHALGSFADLLYAIIRDPAMLAYLDNNESRVGRPNENLARELMELFGLGVGNYSERDVKEAARALTGYTFDDDRFVFLHERHDKGTKTILGSRGVLNGEGFVAAVLARRACADFIASRLYDFFVLHLDSTPDQDRAPARAAASEMADELRRAGYGVRRALRRLFMSRHFYHQRVVNNRIKSPAELVVGAVRTLRTPARDTAVLLRAMDLMGQSLFAPPSVKGWQGGRSWINTSTLFARQNLLVYLISGRLPAGEVGGGGNETYDPGFLLGPGRADLADPSAAAGALMSAALGAPVPGAIGALTDFAQQRGGVIDRETLVGMLLLITAMPEYQLC